MAFFARLGNAGDSPLFRGSRAIFDVFAMLKR